MKVVTVPGQTYVVYAAEGATITAPGVKDPLLTCEGGKPNYVTVPGGEMEISDPEATYAACRTFKNAALALRLLGGGSNGLPAGYTRVEFLESTGTQYVRLPKLEVNNNDTIKSEYLLTGYKDASANGLFSIVGYDSGQYLRLYTTRNTDINGRATGYKFGDAGLSKFLPERELIKFEITKDGCVVNGVQYDNLNTLEFSYSGMLLFTQYVLGQYWPSEVRFYKFSVSQKCKLQPALDPAGKPCMFDLVTRTPFPNNGTGQFIAGVKDTAQLSTVLRKLPDLTGQDMGTLTLSIPAEANIPEMQELMDTTETQKNWELTIQERPAEAATYSLRRVRKVVWVRKVPTENGSYVDASGLRWQTEWCSAIYSPRGNDPSLHGYEPFDSVEQAVEAWGLVPYEYPADELLTEA
jgi:hypothetical protein